MKLMQRVFFLLLFALCLADSSPLKAQVGVDTCYRLLEQADGYNSVFQWQKAYDTAKYFVENCPFHPSASSAFNTTSYAVSNLSSDVERFEEYRQWLSKVLYLNTLDERYYCEAAITFGNSIADYNKGRGIRDVNGAIAVFDYLIESGKCPRYVKMLQDMREDARDYQWRFWKDTVHVEFGDTNVFRLDTTLPSIDELGLSILRGPEYAGVKGKLAESLTRLSVSQNPFTRSTEITFSLRDKQHLKFELFDLLGRKAESGSTERDFDAGVGKFVLDGSGLSPGDYYLRISSDLTGVRTMKLTKH